MGGWTLRGEGYKYVFTWFTLGGKGWKHYFRLLLLGTIFKATSSLRPNCVNYLFHITYGVLWIANGNWNIFHAPYVL